MNQIQESKKFTLTTHQKKAEINFSFVAKANTNLRIDKWEKD